MKIGIEDKKLWEDEAHTLEINRRDNSKFHGFCGFTNNGCMQYNLFYVSGISRNGSKDENSYR